MTTLTAITIMIILIIVVVTIVVLIVAVRHCIFSDRRQNAPRLEFGARCARENGGAEAVARQLARETTL